MPAKGAVQAVRHFAQVQSAFVSQVAQPEPTAYLLVPTANAVNPSEEGMQAYADALSRAADELMQSELASAIESITMTEDMSAMRVVVRNANAAGERQLGRLMRADAEAQNCAQHTQTALMDQVFGLRQRGAGALQKREQTSTAIVNFEVVLNPESTASGGSLYYVINGTVNSPNAAGAEVLVEIHNATGKRMWFDTVLADSMGYFWANTATLNCSSGKRYVLNYGDSITISALGDRQSIKVVPLTAALDADTNKLEGHVNLQLGMTVLAQWDATPNDCNDVLQEGAVTLDATSKFAFVLPFDVKNNETASIAVRNASQTAALVMSAKSIGLSLTHFRVVFYNTRNNTRTFGFVRSLNMRLKPDSQYTITFDIAAVGVRVFTGTATLHSFSAYEINFLDDNYSFIYQLATGSRVTVTGDTNLTWTIPEIQVTNSSYSTGNFVGKTLPGNTIRIKSILNDKDPYNSGNCDASAMTDCAVTTANANGDFLISKPGAWDSISDGRTEFRSIDAQGNFTSRSDIHDAVRVFDTYVSGIWYTNGSIYLRQLRGGKQVILRHGYYPSPDYPEYIFHELDIQSGDVIEIGDGYIFTKTITRPAMSAQLNRATAKFSISSPAGMKATSFLTDFNRNVGRSSAALYCLTNKGGTVVRDFSPTGIQNLSKAYFVVTDADKNLHYLLPRFLGFEVEDVSRANSFPYDYITVQGNGLRANAPVTIQVRNADNSIFYSYTVNSGSSGSFYSGFNTLTPTQKVVIQSDGETSELVVPDLTIERDVANNRVQGNAIPNEPLGLQTSDPYYSVRITKANAAGRYMQSFDDLSLCLSQHIQDCTPIGLEYYAPNENKYTLVKIPAVPPDAFEPDDEIGNATLYTKTQVHNRDSLGGGDDWIKFEPTTSQLGVTQTIRIGMNTDSPSYPALFVEFYQYVSDVSGGQTLTRVGSLNGKQIAFDWLPTSTVTSTLYAVVGARHPPSCDISYSVQLTNQSFWLPVMRR